MHLNLQKPVHLVLSTAALILLAACGGGDSVTSGPQATSGVLTITESYNSTKGDLNFANASGTNSAEGPNPAFDFPYCAIRVTGVKVGTSTDSFGVNLYFKQSDKTVIFAGIINNTDFIAFNMRVKDSDLSKIALDAVAKTASFSAVGLQSNENANDQAIIDGSMSFLGSSTAACGS
jgi:hypothetical protein